MRSRRFLGWVLFLLVLAGSAMPASRAQAEMDMDIRLQHSDTTYAVQPDGTIKVTMQLQYDFGTRSRKKPNVAIPERVARDDGKEAVWIISDLMSASPTASPTIRRLEHEGRELGTFGIYELGESAQEVEEVSYTITYTLRDALAAGPDDSAVLVVPNYNGYRAPVVDAWSLTMTAAGPVSDLRCGRDCTSILMEHGVRFEGSRSTRYSQLSVSANFHGQQRTEQNFVKHWPTSLEVISHDTTVTVDADGTAHVVADLVVNMPAELPASDNFCVPLRARAGIGRQYAFEVSPVTVTNVTAPTAKVTDYTFDVADKSCRYVGITLANHDEQTHLTVAYTVKHAVRIEGDKAIFFFPPLNATSYAKNSAIPSLKITMPGDITATACSESYADDTSCKISDGSGRVSGSTVTFRGYDFHGGWFEVQTSKSSMPNAHPVYISTAKQKIGFALAAALVAAALARAGFGMWRRAQTNRAARNIRALPPELPVFAGAELAASNNPSRVTEAALVELDLDNVIHLGMDCPVTLSPNDGSADAPGLAGIAYDVASTYMDVNVKHRSAALGKISCAVKEELEKEHLVRGFLLPKRARSLWGYLLLGALAAGDIALCVAAIFSTSIVPGVAAAVVPVLIIALIVVENRRYATQPITAEAKTYRTQIEGFANFLSSDTLADLEEKISEELYTQGLPWAVYLGHEEQWISKCLVAAATRDLDHSNWPFISSTEIQWNTFANFVKGKPQKLTAAAMKKAAPAKGSKAKDEATATKHEDSGVVEFEQPEWAEPEQK